MSELYGYWWANWWVRALLYTSLAMLGGFLGQVMRDLDAGKRVRIGRAGIEGVSAGFVGLLVMLICTELALSEHWTGVIVGVSGWLGANASIRMLERVVFKRFGISFGDEDEGEKQ